MRGSRFTEAQIIGVLQEADGGSPTSEVCRRHGDLHGDLLQLEGAFRRDERQRGATAAAA